MLEFPGRPESRRTRSVRGDWSAWLPPAKEQLFTAAVAALESLYSMLSISLDEAFAALSQGLLVAAREHVSVAAALFNRLVEGLVAALRAMEGHGRHFGTLPNVASLDPEFFRGTTAQRLARRNYLLDKLLLSSRSRFFHKLRALAEIVEEVREEFHATAEEIAAGLTTNPRADWQTLEVLHYDLNTCLRETTVVLKSFLCALPGEQVQPFDQTLHTAGPAPARRAAAASSAVGDRRRNSF